MKNKLSSGDSFDVLVVGSGFAGLLAASFSLEQGKSVLLVDALDDVGGRYSPQIRNDFILGAGFSFPQGDLYRQAFDRLKIPLESIRMENTVALTSSTRGWAPCNLEELPSWEAYLAQNSDFYPQCGLNGVQLKLLEYCNASPRFQKQMDFPVTALNVEEGKITKVILGQDLELKPEKVIWAAEFKCLMDILQGDVSIPPVGPGRVSWLRKFSKSNATPGVIMEFAHSKKVADFSETLLLPFTQAEKEERHYLVGAFIGNRDQSLMPSGKQLSSWTFSLSETEWGENHETMKKIRAAHRLLDKAFAGFEGSVEFDRVMVLEHTITPQTKKKSDWHPVLPNLLLAADWASPYGAHNEGILQLLLEKF